MAGGLYIYSVSIENSIYSKKDDASKVMKNIFLMIFILFSNCNNNIGHSKSFYRILECGKSFDLIDDPDKRDEEFALNGRKNVTQEIYDLKIKNSVEVLGDLDVDILGLCEVENKNVLNDLNDAFENRNIGLFIMNLRMKGE